MKLRFILLFLVPISALAHQKVYEHHHDQTYYYTWTDNKGREIKAKFIDFFWDTETLVINWNGQKLEIPFSTLSQESQNLVRKIVPEPKAKPAPPPEPKPEPQFIPKNAAQKILLARIENLERIVMQLDQRNQLIEDLFNRVGKVEKRLGFVQNDMNQANHNMRNNRQRIENTEHEAQQRAWKQDAQQMDRDFIQNDRLLDEQRALQNFEAQIHQQPPNVSGFDDFSEPWFGFDP